MGAALTGDAQPGTRHPTCLRGLLSLTHRKSRQERLPSLSSHLPRTGPLLGASGRCRGPGAAQRSQASKSHIYKLARDGQPAQPRSRPVTSVIARGFPRRRAPKVPSKEQRNWIGFGPWKPPGRAGTNAAEVPLVTGGRAFHPTPGARPRPLPGKRKRHGAPRAALTHSGLSTPRALLDCTAEGSALGRRLLSPC